MNDCIIPLPPRRSLYLQCQRQTGVVACCRLFIFASGTCSFCSELLVTGHAAPACRAALGQHHSKRSTMPETLALSDCHASLHPAPIRSCLYRSRLVYHRLSTHTTSLICVLNESTCDTYHRKSVFKSQSCETTFSIPQLLKYRQ